MGALAFAVTLASGARRRADAATPPPPFELAFHVAPDDAGAPVVPQAWLDVQLEGANALFAPAGVAFARRGAPEPLGTRPVDLVSRADRDALARHVGAPLAARRRIDVFVVGSLGDVDEPGRMRMGVHWRVRKDPERRFVILSQTAGAFVLCHELGHFFGNPHSEIPDNVMSYSREGGLVAFDARQLARITREAAALRALFAGG